MAPEDSRWRQRYQHFDHAVGLLEDALARGVDDLSLLERAGTVQHFEMVIELGWKVMADVLRDEGVDLPIVSPKTVVKEAFSVGIIDDGSTWLDMIAARNLLSHTYSEQVVITTIQAMSDSYLPTILRLRSWLSARTST